MNSIVKAAEKDAQLLAAIGAQSFIESHGHSASAADINTYKNEKYTPAVLQRELSDPENVYHVIYHNGKATGYSKIVFNTSHPNLPSGSFSKLERLYLLKEFYGAKLGHALFELNLQLSKENAQQGMWLFVWKENKRAIDFYMKAGFKIIGNHDFKISDTHSNPNHQLLLEY